MSANRRQYTQGNRGLELDGLQEGSLTCFPPAPEEPTILIRRPVLALLVLALTAAVACSSEPDATEPSTAATTLVPASTEPAPTTTAPPTVTIRGASFRGDLSDQLVAVYSVAMGMPGELRADDLLVEHISSAGLASEDREISVEFSAAGAFEKRVGVVVAGDDVILATREIDGTDWTIIGASLPSLGLEPWFGADSHQLFIIGSDARTPQDPLMLRADSLHIVSVAPDGSSASIVGIPRDSWVETPYGGSNKITNIMAGRGPEAVTQAAEDRSGVEFDGYIVTAFAGFVRLVNDLGGLTIDIPFAMNEPKSDAFFDAGVQMIDGSQALAFARNRTLAGGDLTRSFHQGVLMQWGLLALQEQGPLAIPLFLDALDKHTFTNLTAEQLMLVTAAALAQEDPLQVPNLVVPASVGSVGSASVVFLGDGATAVFTDLQDGVLDTAPE